MTKFGVGQKGNPKTARNRDIASAKIPKRLCVANLILLNSFRPCFCM